MKEKTGKGWGKIIRKAMVKEHGRAKEKKGNGKRLRKVKERNGYECNE